MSGEICSDDLEKEIILMQQELFVKRSLLEECSKKLTNEVSEHMQTKTTAAKHMSENNELKVQLEISSAATKKLEEENSKNRELLIKFQVQMNSYQHERVQLLERCYAAENENTDLKKEVSELKEKLRQHSLLQNNYESRRSRTEALVNEIVTKQETLNKEQKRLETACKESLKYAEKLSEECEFQMKVVREANLGQRKMEDEVIHLMAVLRELKMANAEKGQNQNKAEIENYLDEESTKRRLEELEEDNKRLHEELKLAAEQNEMLLKNF